MPFACSCRRFPRTGFVLRSGFTARIFTHALHGSYDSRSSESRSGAYQNRPTGRKQRATRHRQGTNSAGRSLYVSGHLEPLSVALRAVLASNPPIAGDQQAD